MGAAPISSAATTRCAESSSPPPQFYTESVLVTKRGKFSGCPKCVCVSVPTLFWISNYYNNRPTIEEGPAARSVNLKNFGECRRNGKDNTSSRKAESRSRFCLELDNGSPEYGPAPQSGVVEHHHRDFPRPTNTPPIIAVISSGHGDYKQ